MLVKELVRTNTETSEQTNKMISKHLSSVNAMTAVHHIQCLRGIASCENIVRNKKALKKSAKIFSSHPVSFDIHNRMTFLLTPD